jgi:hypothetical protein
MATVMRYDRGMPLTRTRRRMLIATLVVVVVGVVWWWLLSPKHDPRLIGTWSEENPAGVRSYRFAGDGTGEKWFETNGQLSPLGRNKFHWYSEGDVIVMHEPGIARHLSEDVLNWYIDYIGDPEGWEIDRLDVMSVDANALHVSAEELELTLTRVAE